MSVFTWPAWSGVVFVFFAVNAGLVFVDAVAGKPIVGKSFPDNHSKALEQHGVKTVLAASEALPAARGAACSSGPVGVASVPV